MLYATMLNAILKAMLRDGFFINILACHKTHRISLIIRLFTWLLKNQSYNFSRENLFSLGGPAMRQNFLPHENYLEKKKFYSPPTLFLQKKSPH